MNFEYNISLNFNIEFIIIPLLAGITSICYLRIFSEYFTKITFPFTFFFKVGAVITTIIYIYLWRNGFSGNKLIGSIIIYNGILYLIGYFLSKISLSGSGFTVEGWDSINRLISYTGSFLLSFVVYKIIFF